jgi:hypothetical protein
VIKENDMKSLLGLVLMVSLSGTLQAQKNSDDAHRVANREKMRAALNQVGGKLGVNFRQSDRQPFNFIGSLETGLHNAESMEILVMIGSRDIITVQAYPHLTGGGYINIGRADNGTGLMRKLLGFNDGGFFYWGADDADDIFAAFTFTLESGFPTESVDIVMRSISLLDSKVGELSELFRQR